MSESCGASKAIARRRVALDLPETVLPNLGIADAVLRSALDFDNDPAVANRIGIAIRRLDEVTAELHSLVDTAAAHDDQPVPERA